MVRKKNLSNSIYLANKTKTLVFLRLKYTPMPLSITNLH